MKEMISKYELQNRASDKAFAKSTMLKIDIEQLEDDIKFNNTGPISMQELELVLEGTKIELQVWRYITELIEKSNKE
jgi:hypothetical protein